MQLTQPRSLTRIAILSFSVIVRLDRWQMKFITPNILYQMLIQYFLYQMLIQNPERYTGQGLILGGAGTVSI